MDPRTPQTLLELQQAFAKIVAQPLLPTHRLCDTWTYEAARWITPTSSLSSLRRIELYHQQYWLRLIGCLQKNFPFVTRLFGYSDFEKKIGVPYLYQYPPSHWALCRLGETLPGWILNEYLEDDRNLIFNAASIDWACQEAFWAKQYPQPTLTRLEEMTTKSFYLQPHVHLFALDSDLFAFREKFLQERIEYWDAQPFPEVRFGRFYFAIYRTKELSVCWKEISYPEYFMLSLFKEGLTVQQICSKIEEEEKKWVQFVQENLFFWFREWAFNQWFREEV